MEDSKDKDKKEINTFELLAKKVRKGIATPDEVRDYMTERDLKDLPGYRTYEEESHFTPEWYCDSCGKGPNPCAVSECVECGAPRPDTHADPEQEGFLGSKRAAAGYRKPE